MNHSTYKEALYHFLLAEQAKQYETMNTALTSKVHLEKNKSVIVSEENSYDTHPSTPT